MAGPRDYDAGTRAALFALADGTCFFPGCSERVIKMVDGEPVIAVDIAHIHAATPGGPRFDPKMSDKERAGHPNVILMCTAHHKVIDRDPATYTVEVLTAWKTEREGPNLSALRGLSGLTEERLAEMIEDVGRSSGPIRSVELDFELGVLLPGQRTVKGDPAKWSNFAEKNAGFGEKLVILTARNPGSVRASVESFAVVISMSGPVYSTEQECATEHLDAHPTLPAPLEVGDKVEWLTHFNDIVRARLGLTTIGWNLNDIWGRAKLGSGETIESSKYPVSSIFPAL
jgi:hypothetical protein